MSILRACLTAAAAAALASSSLASSSAQNADRGVAHGRAVYESRCVECHGIDGRGRGPAAAFLTPRPRDFTAGKYTIRTTETGSLPADEDLAQSVRQGLYGTAMPAWDGILSDADMRDVVGYIKSLSPRFAAETPKRVLVGAQVASSPASVARGREAYDAMRCGSCHGSDGRGTGAVAAEFQDDWQQPLRAADLTEPWNFHGGSTSRDVYMRLRTGMSGTPMPSFADAARDPALWDLANYVVSLGRKPVWTMDAGDVAAFYARLDAEARADPVKRGAYLVDTLGCPVCHSPVDANGRVLPGMRLAGGLLLRIEPFGDYPVGNLTSDRNTGLGSWSGAEIKTVITRGILRDGTRLLPYPMDYASYSTLSPGDLDAIVAYLRTVPPVSNRVPKPTRTFLPVYLWGKFKMLILGDDPPMIFFPGNLGTTGSPS
jgi:mono/diheme cytochrome c family protein